MTWVWTLAVNVQASVDSKGDVKKNKYQSLKFNCFSRASDGKQVEQTERREKL